MISVIAAGERREVVTLVIPGAYLHAEMPTYCAVYMCAAATPPTQFGSEKARGRSYLRLLVDFCRTLLATNHYSTIKLRNSF